MLDALSFVRLGASRLSDRAVRTAVLRPPVLLALPSAGECLATDTTKMKHMHNGTRQMTNKQAIRDMLPEALGSVPGGSGFGAIRGMAPQQ